MSEDYPLKYTQYFSSTRERPDRVVIELHWIDRVIKSLLRQDIQRDGRIRRWTYIAEVDKYLRVVVLEDGETVHNAFSDRSFKF